MYGDEEGLRFYKALMPWGGAEVSEPWLGWVWLEWVVGLFFWLAIVVEIVVTLSFEKFANEK